MRISVLAMLAVFPAVLAFAQENQAPRQPIEFNHKLHVTDLKVACKTCHANPDPGEMMGLPEVSTCEQCHSSLPAKTEAERKLAAFTKQNRDLDWVRIYQIPTYVRFNHRQHINTGAKCSDCHGPVGERVHLTQEKPVTMGACVNCHRATRASVDCGSCHEPR